MEELKCVFSSNKSFYNKAMFKKYYNNNELIIELYSYNTLVATIKIDKNNNKRFDHFGYYSQTTSRHQKEFFLQNGITQNEYENLKKNKLMFKTKI